MYSSLGFVNASVVCMDPLNIYGDTELLISSGICKFHFDIMDGIRVPRYGLYPEILYELHQRFEFVSDCHFMVSDVVRAIKEWTSYIVPAKISYHYKDNACNIEYLTSMIRSIGAKAIIAFDLDVPLSCIADVINRDLCDGIMLLSISPGVLRQMAAPDKTISRLHDLHNLIHMHSVECIQVDGGVNSETIPHLLSGGCNELVCGSATLFNIPKYATKEQRSRHISNNIKKLQEVIHLA